MYTFTTEANCIGTDTEAFSTDDHGGYEHPEMLKRICGECVVQKDCLEYALTHEVKGYWGNTTEQQRKIIRKAKNIIPRRLFEDY
jgi:WhiB family redox-sensing transcriptional regulator